MFVHRVVNIAGCRRYLYRQLEIGLGLHILTVACNDAFHTPPAKTKTKTLKHKTETKTKATSSKSKTPIGHKTKTLKWSQDTTSLITCSKLPNSATVPWSARPQNALLV